MSYVSQTPNPDSPLPVRRDRPERDFGIGYGSSSGYRSARRYASDWAPARFRCT